MAPETIWIELSCPFPYKAGAKYLAAIAYPDRADGSLRDQFCRALCRFQVLARAKTETEFARTVQPITPAIFTDDHTKYRTALKKGQDKLNQRLVATNWIVMPHLNTVFSGKVEKIQGRHPGVNFGSALAMENLGWKAAQHKGGKKLNVSSFKTDVWRETRPVAHAAAAYLYWYQMYTGLDARNRPLFVELCLEDPHLVGQILETAEEFRTAIPMITQFTIEKNEMLEFLPILENGALREFIESSD